MKVLTVQVRILRQRQREIEREKDVMLRVSNFITEAVSMGLERDRWACYDVNIEESLSFSETEKILNQVANSSSYYFKPSSLHIKSIADKDKKAKQQKRSSTTADSQDAQKGDLVLTLSGGFLVRRR